MIGRFVRIEASLALAVLAMTLAPNLLPAAVAPHQNDEPTRALHWQSSARWRHGIKKTSGTLVFNDQGVEFRAAKGPEIHWAFEEIQTFKLSQHQLDLTGYQNRKWHFHGERSFRFDLASAVPPGVAAWLAQRVGKPVENADPSANAPVFATLGARRRTRGGGSNGVLRFRDTGIDYFTDSGRGGRSWRWRDIQTLANPDPYHFRVGGYRETFTFELKQPMTRQLFDRLWNGLYTQDLSGLNFHEGARP
jgi:hypothetical protein